MGQHSCPIGDCPAPARPPSSEKDKVPDPLVDAKLDAAIELMYFGYRAMVAKPDRLLAARGLSRVHHRILWFVARLPRPSVSQLLRVLQVSKQAAAAPLRDLYAQGLLTFERGADARVKRLALTPAGRRLEGRLSALQRRQFAHALASAGGYRARGFRAVLTALAADELARSGRDLPRA
jgi:DNA-binding MarR family transcriptional regulator